MRPGRYMSRTRDGEETMRPQFAFAGLTRTTTDVIGLAGLLGLDKGAILSAGMRRAMSRVSSSKRRSDLVLASRDAFRSEDHWTAPYRVVDEAVVATGLETPGLCAGGAIEGPV